VSALQVVQVIIDDASDKTVTGVVVFDRSCGGTLVIPAGTSLPLSGTAGEVFWNSTNSCLYRRSDDNTTWVMNSPNTDVLVSASYVLSSPEPSLPLARILSGSNGVNINNSVSGSIVVTLSSPFTSASHGSARQLIHFIDDGPASGILVSAYKETLPTSSPFPTLEIWWTSALKTMKLLQVETTRSLSQIPITETWKMFDLNGTVIETVSDTISYNGVFETSRVRTIT
jgi:hypothetical protein